MNTILQKTIASLSKQEIINYKLYVNRIKYNKEQKSVTLFNYIKNNKNRDLNKNIFITKIYSKNNTSLNTYNKLNARLINEIDNSLVQFYFHETDVTYIHSELSLYHVFSQKNELDLAFHHLQKAEKKAIAISHYQFLDFIYSEHIQLSVQHGNELPQSYIVKRNNNHKQLIEIRFLDDALNVIVHEIKKTQAIGATSVKTIATLNKAIKRFEQKKEFKNNLVFKSKLFLAVSQVLISQRNFKSLELYATKSFNEFSEKKFFDKTNHPIKLQMLRYICNCLFVNKKHNEALQYIDVFYKAIQEYKGLLYEQNVFFYYNALANNYSILNPQKVIDVLSKAKDIPAIINHPSHLGYVYLNLAGAYLGLKQHKIALKNILNLYLHKSYQTLSVGIQLQVNIIELLIRLESNDIDFGKKLVSTILKQYKKTLLLNEHKADNSFILLIKRLIEKSRFEKNKTSIKLVSEYIKMQTEHNNATIVDYAQWLKTQFL